MRVQLDYFEVKRPRGILRFHLRGVDGTEASLWNARAGELVTG